jgi:DNA excision repair protein ERCC-5
VLPFALLLLLLLLPDASIWLFQFMRAMRDERGEMIKNAHLLGFFRRICR